MGKNNRILNKTSKLISNQHNHSSSKLRQRKYLSTTKLITRQRQRCQKISITVKKQLKKIVKKQLKDKKSTKRLQSVLNIKGDEENEVVGSALNIPSIENMISLQQIQIRSMEKLNSFDSGSLHSFGECLEYRAMESEPDLMINYLGLVQKVMKKIDVHLESRQKELVIKGIWNLLVKYWKDGEEWNEYKNINSKIEWGLFQLLNFDLSINLRERIVKELQINSFQFLKQNN